MIPNRNEMLKKVGRNRMKIANQKSGTEPTLNENKGAGDGGVIGRYKKSVRKTGVYRGA